MHPVLFYIGDFAIPSYGAILVVTFLLSLYLLKKEAFRLQMDGQKVADTAIATLLFGLLGAKLLLILVELPRYLQNPREIFGTLRSAGVIYGGLIGGALGGLWYIRRHKLQPWATLDVMAPFAALGVGLGRLSCFMAGCCYGIPYDGPLHLVFPDKPYCDAPPGVDLFPVQLVGLLNGLILFGVLLLLLRRRRFEGQVILSFFGLYGITRGLIELLRGDQVRGLWFGDTLSTSQIIAIIAVLTAGYFYYKKSKEART